MLYPAHITLSEALERFEAKTLGYATRCGNCTACCRTYTAISHEVEILAGNVCSKLKTKGCKIYSRRPQACKTYSCYPFFMARMTNPILVANGGKTFTFALHSSADYAKALILFCVSETYVRVGLHKGLRPETAVAIVMTIAAQMSHQPAIYNDFLALQAEWLKPYTLLPTHSEEFYTLLQTHRFTLPAPKIAQISQWITQAIASELSALTEE